MAVSNLIFMLLKSQPRIYKSNIIMLLIYHASSKEEEEKKRKRKKKEEEEKGSWGRERGRGEEKEKEEGEEGRRWNKQKRKGKQVIYLNTRFFPHSSNIYALRFYVSVIIKITKKLQKQNNTSYLYGHINHSLW